MIVLFRHKRRFVFCLILSNSSKIRGRSILLQSLLLDFNRLVCVLAFIMWRCWNFRALENIRGQILDWLLFLEIGWCSKIIWFIHSSPIEFSWLEYCTVQRSILLNSFRIPFLKFTTVLSLKESRTILFPKVIFGQHFLDLLWGLIYHSLLRREILFVGRMRIKGIVRFVCDLIWFKRLLLLRLLLSEFCFVNWISSLCGDI